MSLVLTLGGIRRFPDLTGLMPHLGQSSLWEELDPSVLVPRGSSLEVTAASVLGRTTGFEWLAIATGDPLLGARKLATRFIAQGKLVGVIAFDERSRTLAVAIAAGRGPSAILSLPSPDPRVVQRFERLGRCGPATGLSLALRLAEILEEEDAGRRFFTSFRHLVTQFSEGLSGRLRPEQRHHLALLNLTRVLFLYFVQCKGWLDGRPDFLRQAVDDCLARRRRLHRHLFQPLFFGTLNRRAEARGRARCFGRIPFLNGGLFEPHTLERQWRGEVPNAIWRDAFDHLFERFAFTVNENGAEGEVAPDMLGRVFEGVMEPEARHGSGTFYTPVHLVSQLVDATLEAYLASRLDCPLETAAERLGTPDPTVRRLVAEVTVLDPAVGSGAFLLGMLERLADLNESNESGARIRRTVLARNLFGVDLNPMAVRLTELRLWLAVIAHDPAQEPEAVEPLPNLDGLIRQGDSLLDPARMVTTLPLMPRAAAQTIAELRRRFVVAVGENKQDLARRLRQTELAAMLECLDGAIVRVEAEAAECLGDARTPDLFGRRRGLDREMRQRLHAARHQLQRLRRLRRRVTEEGQVPWFQFECHFADVVSRGGFDIVVGNPPWVRAEDLPPAQRGSLAERYRWWHSGGSGFAHQPDLAIAFLERGLELLGEGGVLGFLLPAKLATAAYGAAARRGLAAQTTIYRLTDLTTPEQNGFDATVYPLALVASKTAGPRDHLVQTTLGSGSSCQVSQCRLLGGAPWILLPSAAHDALDLIRSNHPTLGERFVLQLGAKTGANQIFLEPPEFIEGCLIKWGIRGRDVRPFGTADRIRLLWPHDDRG
ncbi:MAG TPA: N-6 DNA methylase, partial [Gemmatimonadales bacterium]|nr:N-6 DNA methylase [Gemmatimonadales bacterium]